MAAQASPFAAEAAGVVGVPSVHFAPGTADENVKQMAPSLSTKGSFSLVASPRCEGWD